MNGQIALPLGQSIAWPGSWKLRHEAGAEGSISVRYRQVGHRRAIRRRVDTSDGKGPGWVCEPYRAGATGVLRMPGGTGSARVSVHTGLEQQLGRLLVPENPRVERVQIGRSFGTDPYPDAEELFGVTRDVLTALGEARDLKVLIATRSPLLLRDQAILRFLDLYHSVTVRVPIPTLDAELCRLMEPESPEPAARLELVRRLAADGVAVEVLAAPVLPRINNGADELEPLLAAARNAGAIDVSGEPLPASLMYRRRLDAWLGLHFPDRAEAVRRLTYSRPPSTLLSTFDRLRLAYGFPVFRTGRG